MTAEKTVPTLELRMYLKNIFLLGITGFLVLVTQFSCGGGNEKSKVEIGRLVSPDSLVTAIIVENQGGGVAGSVGVLIYIEPIGEEIKDYDTYRLSATKVDGLSLHWVEPNLLEIHYKKARIYNFRNIWQSEKLQNFRYVVELRLVKDGNEKMEFHDT